MAASPGAATGRTLLRNAGDTPLRMPSAKVPSPRFEGGTLAMVPPGTIVMPGAPLAWWTCRREPELVEAVPVHRIELRSRPIQVWREMDAEGRFTRDRVTDLDRTVERALPLLVPVLVDGERQEAFLDQWATRDDDRWASCVLSQTIFANMATLPPGATSGGVLPGGGQSASQGQDLGGYMAVG